ncbi:MAG TPA: hypothetical protein VGG06_20535 [Thermoanaerobaculia bacterium]|jgi:hypothetical protein
MVALTALWLPILLSAVAAFIASSILHMVLTYHRSDYSPLPGEANIQAAMRKEGVARGHYVLPHCTDMKEMTKPEVKEKYEKGPVALITVMPSGLPSMAKPLVSWFVYCVVISVFVAYLAGRTLAAGTDYLMVFRVAGTTAFLGYAAAQATNSIWGGLPWGITIKHMFDGLIYALLTAGFFGWLWPS